MGKSDTVQGEGNYEATREYNDATREFIESGRVEQAARDAAAQDSAEEQELERAEAEGLRHAKEEDPALYGDVDLDTAEGVDDDDQV